MLQCMMGTCVFAVLKLIRDECTR